MFTTAERWLIKPEYAEKIRKEKEKEGFPGTELVPFIYNLIDEAMQHRELLRDWAPLQFINAIDSSVFLKDRIKHVTVELVVKDGDLTFLEDESKSCVHIGFARAIPAVYRVMKEHGRKPPRS